MKTGKQFKTLKERMRPEARARAGDKAESLLRSMSSDEQRAGREAEESAQVNGREAVAGGADPEAAK